MSDPSRRRRASRSPKPPSGSRWVPGSWGRSPGSLGPWVLPGRRASPQPRSDTLAATRRAAAPARGAAPTARGAAPTARGLLRRRRVTRRRVQIIRQRARVARCRVRVVRQRVRVARCRVRVVRRRVRGALRCVGALALRRFRRLRIGRVAGRPVARRRGGWSCLSGSGLRPDDRTSHVGRRCRGRSSRSRGRSSSGGRGP